MKIDVVSFQVPFPADYGGVIDVYHKLRALSSRSVEVRLHTYAYGGRQSSAELCRYCREVNLYQRDMGARHLLDRAPYIVATRRNPQLLERLLESDAPVLLEGLHCCGFLHELRRAGKKVIVRTHNVEHDYYAGLARNSKSLPRSLFYRTEAWKLRRFEETLGEASALVAISDDDAEYYYKRFPGVKTIYVPPFFDDEPRRPARGCDVDLLYHGNLTVGENVEAVEWIVDEVMPRLSSGARLTVAGKDPSPQLCAKVAAAGGNVVANPDDATMRSLVASAKINLLVTNQSTGMKLKLMNVLVGATGHCLVNSAMLTDPSLRRFCTVADGAEALAAAADRLMADPRSPQTAQRVASEFLKSYGTAVGADAIIKLL